MENPRVDRLARLLASRQNRRQSVVTLAGAAAALSITQRTEAATVVCAITCPSTGFVPAFETCEAVITYLAPDDNGMCGMDPTIVCDPASGSSLPIGQHTVNCSVPNTPGACSFFVIVADGNETSITCPADILIETDVPAAVTLLDPEVGTVCGNTNGLIADCDFASGDVFPLGTTLVTCAILVPAGKVPEPTTCTYNVTLQPAQATVTPTEEATIEQPTFPPFPTFPPDEPTLTPPKIPTAVAPTSVPGDPTATSAPVSQLPNTGAGSGGSGAGKLVSIAAVGAGAALLARLGLRRTSPATEETPE